MGKEKHQSDSVRPSGHCDSHLILCNRIHPGAHHRNIQFNLFRQVRLQANLIWYHFRICRHQQHIVKGNTVANNLTHDLSSLSLICNMVINSRL